MGDENNDPVSCPHYKQELVCPIRADQCPCPGRRMRVSITAVQERECKKWAHELHDGLAQIIGGSNLQVEALMKTIGKMEMADIIDHLASIRDELRTCQLTMRVMIEDLRSPYVSGGLLESLNIMLDKIRPQFDIDTRLPDTIDCVSQLVQVDLFRIIQEALINVKKHSKATKIKIEINIQENHLKLSVQDNGCGFDPILLELKRQKKTPRFGLLSMKERTEILGGVFTLQTAINKGTMINATIPKVGIMGSGIKWMLTEWH